MMQLRTDRNWLIVAITRSGKTLLMMVGAQAGLDAGYPRDRLHVLNPRNENKLREWAQEHKLDHWVPPMLGRGGCHPELSARLTRWLGEGNHWVLCDEIQMVSKANDPDPIWRYWFSAGNGRGCAVHATCTRGVFMASEAFTEARYISCFATADPGTIAKLRVRSAELADQVPHLEPYHFLHHELGGALTHEAPLTGLEVLT